MQKSLESFLKSTAQLLVTNEYWSCAEDPVHSIEMMWRVVCLPILFLILPTGRSLSIGHLPPFKSAPVINRRYAVLKTIGSALWLPWAV
jgi:hypothetical protein